MTHKPIKTEFRWTGDGYGNAYARMFKQVKRVGDIAMYSRISEKTNSPDGYEVIKISRHNGYTLVGPKGAARVQPAETYPGPSQFGKTAWSCINLDHAERIFNKKVEEAKQQAALEASGKAPKKRGRPRKVVVG